MLDGDVNIILEKIYGKGSVRKATSEEIQESKDYHAAIQERHRKFIEEYEPDESLKDITAQCSRCLHLQQADLSETGAMTCENCGEIDFAYTDDDIVMDFF